MWTKWVWLFCAGGLGVWSRYLLGGTVQRWTNGAFPWGTFVVNLVGCLVFGVIWSLADERKIISHETRFLILTGFMGAFTTFSTFAFDTGNLLHHGQWWYAVAYVLGHNVVGVLGVTLGIAVGRWF